MSSLRRRPKRSLRTILTVWFVLFSIVPLAFVAWYSILRFEKAIDHELVQRLDGNSGDVQNQFNDIQNQMHQRAVRLNQDPSFLMQLNNSDAASIKVFLGNQVKNDNIQSLTAFNRDGRLIASAFKDQKSQVRTFVASNQAIFLSGKYLTDLAQQPTVLVVESNDKSRVSLIKITKVQTSGGRLVGYLEQIFSVDQAFIDRFKKRTKLEALVFKEDANVVLATHPDFLLYRDGFFKRIFTRSADKFFELNVRRVPYGFSLYRLNWGEGKFLIALGASKADTKAALKNINTAFFTVVGAVAVLVIITVFVASSFVLKPLYDLVEAIKSFESEEQAVTIPVRSDTEIGVLTESFNEMSKKIWQARSDLRKKIHELESANKELKETQTKLVHSAKMVSLGQLVAGVAHELNNPIGFIYSNMSHLQEYADKLIELVEIAEKNPQDLSKYKEEFELDYIKKDLPRLVASCQDGARRTRDIVLGLRNFSRLEEAKLQEVDLHQSIDTTLNLIHGELKTRVQIHRQYEPIPYIYCYASQINQVLMNILSNAAQAIEGEGHIWISTSVPRGPDKKNMVQISIQDSGKGMDASTLEKIFDPFFTTKGVGQGTGLGLSISYGIIQNHGGEIQVRSEPNVGTEFIITLPINPPTRENV